MKRKFSLKLTAFLVSLFISLIIIILGNKNKYCLSFGFMLLGLSIASYVLYNDEKTAQTIVEIDEEIAKLDADDTIDEGEQAFMLQELYVRQAKLLKRKKKVAFTFYLCAALLVLLGFFGIF